MTVFFLFICVSTILMNKDDHNYGYYKPILILAYFRGWTYVLAINDKE